MSNIHHSFYIVICRRIFSISFPVRILICRVLYSSCLKYRWIFNRFLTSLNIHHPVPLSFSLPTVSSVMALLTLMKKPGIFPPLDYLAFKVRFQSPITHFKRFIVLIRSGLIDILIYLRAVNCPTPRVINRFYFQLMHFETLSTSSKALASLSL